MTVPELLLHLGHPLGQRNRTTCPIHRGDNASVFWFSELGWTCWGGCGHGGVRQLQLALGLLDADLPAPTYRIAGLEGLLDSTLVSPPTLTETLTRQVLAEREAWDAWAAERHRAGLRLVAQGEATLPLLRAFPAVREALDAICGQFWSEARVELDKAHRVWGAWPWPCGCHEGDAW